MRDGVFGGFIILFRSLFLLIFYQLIQSTYPFIGEIVKTNKILSMSLSPPGSNGICKELLHALSSAL